MDIEIKLNKKFVKWAFKKMWHFKIFLKYVQFKIQISYIFRRYLNNEK